MFYIRTLYELFIKKLKYENIIVFGNDSMVNILYQVKDQYGKSMNWLVVMFESCQTLKEYHGGVLKRFHHVFLHSQHLLESNHFLTIYVQYTALSKISLSN